jgi:O-antigen/teichoic acid export membrane protein
MKKELLSLGNDILIYGIGSVLLRFIGVFTLPLFTSYLSPEEYGVLAMLTLLAMVVQPIFGLGLSAAIGPSYFESTDLEGKSKVVWSSFLISLVSVMVLLLSSWFFSASIGRIILLPGAYIPLISLSLFGCGFTILATPFIQRVQFEKKVSFYITITIVSTLCSILVSVYLVVYRLQGLKGMLWGQLAGNFITCIVFMLEALKRTKLKICVQSIKTLLRLGLPLVPAFALVFVLMHSNKYILKLLSGLDAVGIYSIGFSLGSTISLVTNGVSSAWYPFFMGFINRQEEVNSLFGRVTSYYVVGGGYLCLLFVLFAKPVVLLLSQSSFHEAHVVVGAVAVANFAQTLFYFFLPGVYFRKEIKFVAVVQGIAVILSMPLNYFLIRYFSVLGAGIGLALSNLMMAALMYLWNLWNQDRYININYEFKRIGLFFLMISIIVLVYFMLPSTVVMFEFIKSIVFSCLGIIGVIMLLNKQERSFLFKKLSNK